MLNSRSAKDAPHNGTDGVEGIYWEGTEAGLMGIPLFPGLIYATDGSQEKGNMGAIHIYVYVQISMYMYVCGHM